MVVVSVYKKSGNIEHKFECDGFPCSSRQVTLDNFVFGLNGCCKCSSLLHLGTFLDFVDTSTVVLSGTVSIANTAQYNGGLNIPCQIIDVQVCAVNHYGAKENLDCTRTDGLGTIMLVHLLLRSIHTFVGAYSLSVAMGLSVEIVWH